MSAEAASVDAAATEKERIVFDDDITRKFLLATVVVAVVALLAGVTAALQLAFYPANMPPFLNFGRLRPLHTNAAIFGFVGNTMFAGMYYSTQRLAKVRMASKLLSNIHFWGWQLIIVGAAITLPLGITSSKEYAELEWPLDIAIAVVWVTFAINYFWTLSRRREKHLYVAIWFYISTIITIAVLHIFNNLELPVFAFKSYSIYGGAQDALVQWWYGHNAVAFFLTTPILGLMYYFVPKAAERPVYSYRLSIVHFWALIFVYIWAGPHHLLYTALPDWAQSLGMIFSLVLWAPSWGGMLNGLLTLRGAWDKVRAEPALKFFAASVTFYGMSTFEGPLMSIKSVNGLAHFTDWVVGHVHSGALGWNGLMAAGMVYWMTPRLYGTKLHSKPLAETHFYLATIGIILYVVSMWVSGVTQGLMWRAMDEKGVLLYPTFVETLIAIRPMYWVRFAGGTLYLTGMIMMAYNFAMTVRAGKAVNGEITVPVLPPKAEPSWAAVAFGKPVLLIAAVTILVGLVAVLGGNASAVVMAVACAVTIGGTIALQAARKDGHVSWHRLLEGKAAVFSVFSLIAILIGGAVEIIPTIIQVHPAPGGTATYSALELEGRDIYVREGCYVCHSQMIRAMPFEVIRYGEMSKFEESKYDHPFQWGSKRTGPDLARVGGKYPNLWHYSHMRDPRSTSPGSNMPPYTFLTDSKVDFGKTQSRLLAQRTLGVPYTDAQITNCVKDAKTQADGIAKDLREQGVEVAADSELVALISYLQHLGKPPTVIPSNVPAVAAAPVPAVEK